MKARIPFTNHRFNRFIELALTRIAPDYLHLLTEEDRRNIARKGAFIRNSDLEQKLLLLAKVGYPFVITIADRKKKYLLSYIERIVKYFFKTLTFHRKPASFILKDHSFFFLSDLDTVRSLSLCANVHHSPVNAYRTISASLQEYKATENKLSRDLQSAQVLDALAIKAVRLGASNSHQEQFESLYRINYKKFMILAYVSRMREATMTAIKKEIGLLHIKSDLVDMVREGLLQSKREAGNSSDEHFLYWITGFGELTLMKARNYFLL